MTKEEKNRFIDELAETIGNSPIFYLADTSELTVETTNKLRRSCHQRNVTLKVVKNALLKKALDRVEAYDYSEMYDALKGPTSIMTSEVANAPAKLIKDFRKKNNKPFLKAAFIDESIYLGDEQLDTLSALKSKEELIGDIISLLQSPITNVVSGLQASAGGKVAGLVKALEERGGA